MALEITAPYAALADEIKGALGQHNQAWVAARCGVRPSAVTQWMQGTTKPSLANLARLCLLLQSLDTGRVSALAGYSQDTLLKTMHELEPPTIPLEALLPYHDEILNTVSADIQHGALTEALARLESFNLFLGPWEYLHRTSPAGEELRLRLGRSLHLQTIALGGIVGPHSILNTYGGLIDELDILAGRSQAYEIAGLTELARLNMYTLLHQPSRALAAYIRGNDLLSSTHFMRYAYRHRSAAISFARQDDVRGYEKAVVAVRDCEQRFPGSVGYHDYCFELWEGLIQASSYIRPDDAIEYLERLDPHERALTKAGAFAPIRVAQKCRSVIQYLLKVAPRDISAIQEAGRTGLLACLPDDVDNPRTFNRAQRHGHTILRLLKHALN